MTLQGSYDPVLVLFSVVIAIFAAFTALNLISRLGSTSAHIFNRTRIASAGLVLGLGIWSMHFVAMLAYQLPVPVRYDGILTLLSLITAIIACGLGLGLAVRKCGSGGLLAGGALLGAGIASMHYIGMAAMRVPAMMSYDYVVVGVSVLIGIGAAMTALWVSFAMGRGEIADSFFIRFLSAVIMGFAIAGMHYTGMAAMTFRQLDNAMAMSSGLALNPSVIGVTLTLSAILLMSFALWSSRLMAETHLIRANEEKIRAITENVNDVIITINCDSIIEFANAATASVFGYRPEELIGRHLNLLMPVHLRGSHDRNIHHYLQSGVSAIVGHGQRELQAIHKDGTQFPVDIAVSEARSNGETLFIGVIRDITERIASEQRLEYLVHHDALTALPNRLSFQEHVEQALAHARRRHFLVAVLFLDLDRFKVINDTLGHHVGDFMLQEIAHRLRDCVREGDIIARISGDEFTVLLDDVAAQPDVAPIAREILDALAQPFDYSQQELFTSASIGISLFPDDCDDPASLMKHADIAMYRAKADGGNCYRFYTGDMDVHASERLNLESNLRRALEREEFQLYYQPQVDLTTGAISGVEALIRWQHPDYGLVSPLDFIPLLEETGLIVPVGEWVIHTACRQNRAWQDAGLPPMRVAVNLSARQFYEQGLVQNVVSILSKTGLSPEYLELEITESVLMQQTGTTMSALRQLHAFGVQLAIDDFGTGYSSLSYLRRFPIHTLKIDRSFMRDVNNNPDDAALVQLIIDMAHSLKLNVVAEGVENEAQLAFLHQRHCKLMQGFYFCPPQPSDKLLDYLSSGFKVAASH